MRFCVSCSAALTIPDEAEWDVTTNADGMIVERHYAAVCPACGYLADRYDDPPADTNIVSVAVDPPVPMGGAA